MSQELFVWTDLSTFDLPQARMDYEALFNWQFQGDESYDFAMIKQSTVAAVFPMPPKLIDIKMPSFWMSYIRVRNIEEVTAKAATHEGVIVEVKPQAFNENASISLIRDPSGAGFTLYEGPEIMDATGSIGQVINRYHHLPDLGLIESFYKDLFGWSFNKTKEDPWPVYNVADRTGAHVAYVEEVPETIRGKFRYWMPCFGVKSLESAFNTLDKINGQTSAELGGERYMVADRQGASFMIQLV